MKIFLHLGYPKTATTYLQKNIFSNHPDINYIGKFYKNPNKSKFIFELEKNIFCLNDKDFRKYVIKIKPKIKEKLNKKKINLISNEAFLINYNYNKISTTEKILDRLLRLFDKNLKIYILIFIRNHKDALRSNFNQFKHLLRRHDIFLKDLKFAINNNQDNVFLNNFNYYSIIKILKKNKLIFKTRIFFYEDFDNNKNFLMKSLCKFLNIKYLPHLNKDEKVRTHEDLKNNRLKELINLIKITFKNKSFKLRYIINFFNFITKREEYEILEKKHFDQYNERVMNFYSSDTKKLDKKYHKKLKKYFYLKNK